MARWLPLLALAWAGTAGAHAGLASSNPADGAVVSAAPARAELRFAEPVTPLVVRLFHPSGAPQDLRLPPRPGEVLMVELPPDLPKGTYTLSYRVISLDSHPVGGSLVFTVGVAASAAPRAAPADEMSTPAAVTLMRGIRDLALLIAAGCALFTFLIRDFPGERAMLLASAVVAFITALAGIGLQAVWTGAGWHATLFSSFGLSACVAAGAATILMLGRNKMLMAAGALAIVCSLPLTGHALTARPAALAMTALTAHALAAAFWAGSLAALMAISLRRPGQEAAAALRRFSRLGIVAVAVLLAAGTTFAILQLSSLGEIVASPYGRLILGKVLLLAALLVLATLNRFVWLPSLERGAAAAAVRLRRSIAGELGLVACAVALTALLVHTAPQRAFTHPVVYKDVRAEVTVDPARAGVNVISVRFSDAQGAFDPDEVLLEVGNEEAGVEPAPRALRRTGSGLYTRQGSELAFPGVWTIDVHARMGADQAAFRSRVRIR